MNKLIGEIQGGNFARLECLVDDNISLFASNDTLNRLLELIKQLDKQKIKDYRKVCISLLGLIDSNVRLEWLRTKPDVSYVFLICAKDISIRNMYKVVNDEMYFSKAFTDCNKLSDKNIEIILKLVKDPYLKEKLFTRFTTKDISKEQYTSYIDRYNKIRKQLSKLKTEEEKVDFICSLQPEVETIEEYNDINSIKKSLLNEIKNLLNRDRVISSISSLTKSPLDKYKDLVRKIIIEYLSSGGPLSKEMLEKIDITFNAYHIKLDDLKDDVVLYGEEAGTQGSVKGDHSRSKKLIRIDQNSSISSQLFTMLHEFRTCII